MPSREAQGLFPGHEDAGWGLGPLSLRMEEFLDGRQPIRGPISSYHGINARVGPTGRVHWSTGERLKENELHKSPGKLRDWCGLQEQAVMSTSGHIPP